MASEYLDHGRLGDPHAMPTHRQVLDECDAEVVRQAALTYDQTVLKDSGQRESFSTGSVRDTRAGKGRFDLMFMGMPEALRRLAVLLERGAAKYGERNWEKGQPISRFLDSAARHLHRAAQGHTDEDHLVQLAWNALAAVQTLHRIKEGTLDPKLNDVYHTHDVEPR